MARHEQYGVFGRLLVSASFFGGLPTDAVGRVPNNGGTTAVEERPDLVDETAELRALDPVLTLQPSAVSDGDACGPTEGLRCTWRHEPPGMGRGARITGVSPHAEVEEHAG